jgi:hypothetical protein
VIDLSGVVLGFADTTVTVTRSVSAWGADGRPTTTTTTIGPFPALLTPRSSRSVNDVQGDRNSRQVDIYSATVLQVGDTFAHRGYVYEVQSVGGFETTGNFCTSQATGVPAP